MKSGAEVTENFLSIENGQIFFFSKHVANGDFPDTPWTR